MGTQPIGQTVELFSDSQAGLPIVHNPASQLTVQVDDRFWSIEPQFFAVTDDGNIALDEADLLQLCNQRSTLCSDGFGQVRVREIDLLNGGAVVYLDVNLGVPQRVGLVLQMNENGNFVSVPGIDVSGTLYDLSTLPTEIQAVAADGERIVNRAMRTLILRTGGASYVPSRVRLTDTMVIFER